MWKCCAPNPAKKCMQLLGEHQCITFQLRMQRKDESFNACRFRAPAKCTPTVSQNFHSGGGCDVEVLRPQSCKEMHATAWRASLHHISTSYAKKRRKFQRLPFLGTRQVHPHSQLKISQWGWVCSRGGARRLRRFGVYRLHCEYALIMFDLYS